MYQVQRAYFPREYEPDVGNRDSEKVGPSLVRTSMEQWRIGHEMRKG
jgi:hypothetical protein